MENRHPFDVFFDAFSMGRKSKQLGKAFFNGVLKENIQWWFSYLFLISFPCSKNHDTLGVSFYLRQNPWDKCDVFYDLQFPLKDFLYS